MALSVPEAGSVGFTVHVLREICLLLAPIKRLPRKGFVSIEFTRVSMARQRAGILLVAGVGEVGSVVEKVLDVMGRVLEARCSGPRSVDESVAPCNALWKPAVVVRWLQRFTAFVLRKKRVNKIGAHDLFA